MKHTPFYLGLAFGFCTALCLWAAPGNPLAAVASNYPRAGCMVCVDADGIETGVYNYGSVTLADNVATTVCTIPTGLDGDRVGGVLHYTVDATDAAGEQQGLSGLLTFMAVNEDGTWTVAITDQDVLTQAKAISAGGGTLTVTSSISGNTIQLTADTSLTTSTFTARVDTIVHGSNAAVARVTIP